MNRIVKTVQSAALYTVLITALFLLFAAVTGYETPAITAGRYFIILAFGVILSAADLLFLLKSLPNIVKIALRYAISLTAFLVLFLFVGGMIPRGATTVFAITFLFTALYFLFSLLFFLLRRLTVPGSRHKSEEEPADYTPRYDA